MLTCSVAQLTMLAKMLEPKHAGRILKQQNA